MHFSYQSSFFASSAQELRSLAVANGSAHDMIIGSFSISRYQSLHKTLADMFVVILRRLAS